MKHRNGNQNVNLKGVYLADLACYSVQLVRLLGQADALPLCPAARLDDERLLHVAVALAAPTPTPTPFGRAYHTAACTSIVGGGCGCGGSMRLFLEPVPTVLLQVPLKRAQGTLGQYI